MIRTIRMTATTLLAVGALVASAAAFAHAGHAGAGGFAAGLLHPLTGLDHLAVLLAVGLLAGGTGGRAAWALPVAFLSTMAVTATLTATGAAVGWAEYGVWASLLAAVAALAFGIRGPVIISVAAVAVFAAFHGVVHGAEAVADARAQFLAGVLLAAGGLQAAGAVSARTMAKVAAARTRPRAC